MAKVVVYCDVDGVVGDWEARALKLYGLKNDLEMRNYLKNGGELEDKLTDLRERVDDAGSDFWSKIKLFSWAQDLYLRLNKFGEFAFLTSSGNHSARPNYAAGGAHGKLIWLSEHFNEASVSICRDKYIHAHSKAILIDDNKRNVDKFIEAGGVAFLFPHAYRIEDGELDFEEVYGEIEKKILEM